eukprot:5375833-Pleurochrysis_carterae.AAC.3
MKKPVSELAHGGDFTDPPRQETGATLRYLRASELCSHGLPRRGATGSECGQHICYDPGAQMHEELL